MVFPQRWQRRSLHPRLQRRIRSPGTHGATPAGQRETGRLRLHAALATSAARCPDRKMKKPSDPDIRCACAAIRHASRLITQIYEEELREHLATPQFQLLSVLHALPGCNQTTLARRLDLDKTTLSRNLKLLEKN